MKPRFLQRRPTASQSTTQEVVAGARASLPPELLNRAVSRVRTLCLVLGAVALLYTVVTVLLHTGTIHAAGLPQAGLWSWRFYGVAAFSILLSAGVYLATSSPKLPPERAIDLGLVLQILGALCVTTAEYLTPLPPVVNGISYVCIWILSFNLLPATPRRAAVAALAAASMGPVGLLINVLWNSRAWPDAGTTLLMFLPNYVAAAVAIVTSAMVHRLGADVARARRLGSYQLVEKLGQGGMGEVWRAEHRSLIRPAAVKILRRDVLAGQTLAETESIVSRFRREVQATALLQSPHTVAIYDFGRSDEGTLYYVMELLRGIDLQTLVKRGGPVPAERVIHILKQVCHSLADAHRFGLVHRDIKPANIHLCVLGLELDFVKVLDFGLVKDLRQALDSGLTIDGIVQGTPAYLAPEAAVGGEIDARADLYALGCVGYFLLTGTMVFSGETALTMLAAHVRKVPDPPSRRSEMPIPADLEELILSCLAKSPAERPQSAAEMAKRLDRIAVGNPWTRERAERWWQVNQPQLLAAGVGGVGGEPGLVEAA